ncbi:MAG: glycosyltransferase [Cyanobacteriota bacterium]|nr:glycosyltransferase [Cyanobacteriota bacterium]
MTAISLIMPTVDWGPTFGLCLQAAHAGLRTDDQLLVVFDGVPPPPPDWLHASGAVLLHTGTRSGPAAARNLGANKARHPILLFVDADVQVSADAIKRIRAHFNADPDLAALFGSYDDRPAAPGLVSRFRNLLHHHTHTSNAGQACTFWAGCGAVRRDSFLALGGFDAETYREPCIEDIDFGLRLSDAGGRILLDPSITGKHHKRWTLGLMVRTDIRQRAIPWSRLLLRRRQLPTTLNLSTSARLSAASSLLIPVALAAVTIPLAQGWGSLALAVCLALILLLNRPFLALLWRQGGIPLAAGGTGLLILYLIYSSLSLAAVAVTEMATAPVQAPDWLRARPDLERRLCWAGLALLALVAATAIVRGLVVLGLAEAGHDIHQRFDEWRLFRDQIYPSPHLADAEARELPYFRTTVYLPWALPLFGILFAGGGMVQGKLLISTVSLIALALMAAIGWATLRPLGKRAGWLGMLTPMAIAGNGTCLAMGQFSIICMGLISLQWILLARRRSLSAGVCWALAMLKPQIALPFVIPLLRRRHWGGFATGTGLLLALSGVALFHTRTPAGELVASWIRILPSFINGGHHNALAMLFSLKAGQAGAVLGPATMLLITIIVALPWLSRVFALRPFLTRTWQALHSSPLELAGLCGLIGLLGFYHRGYDNIMLFPALLAAWRTSLAQPRWTSLIITLLSTISSWSTDRMQLAIPEIRSFNVMIWSLSSIWLMWLILSKSPSWVESPTAAITQGAAPSETLPVT